MKTALEWEQEILQITQQINQEYPELIKYMNEIPVKTGSEQTDGVAIKNLEDYYNSLVAILKDYAETHIRAKKQN